MLFTFGAEMNGNWVDWGCLPAVAYIALYRKAHDVGAEELAGRDSAIDPRRSRWVYGPNACLTACRRGGHPYAA